MCLDRSHERDMMATTASDTNATPNDLWQFTDHGQAIEIIPSGRRYTRTLLYVPFVGGAGIFRSWLRSRLRGHCLWGAPQLAAMGYRIILLSRPNRVPLVGHHLVQDIHAIKPFLTDLRDDDIVFCNHNTMFWIPLICSVRPRIRLVGYLYAREPLPLIKRYHAVGCMTPAAARQARQRAPRVQCALVPWGIDLSGRAFEPAPFSGKYLLSVGSTGRDDRTLFRASELMPYTIRKCSRGAVSACHPDSVIECPALTPEMVADMHGPATAVLLSLRKDTHLREAVGYTSLLESLAHARPVIKTRTGAIDELIDVDGAGVGRTVPPADPAALAREATFFMENRDLAEEAGLRGRRLIENRFSISHFAEGLHKIFSDL